MWNTQIKDMNKPETDLTEQDILSWFKAHPKAWQDIPELRAVIENSDQASTSDGTTSLADFQLRRLKQENKKLQAQLQSLMSVAQTNEQLMRRLHAMGLEWAPTASIDAFLAQFRHQLAQDFGADAVCLHLDTIPIGLTEHDGVFALDQKTLEWLGAHHTQHAQCGRFTQLKLSQLFPASESAIQSAAVVRLELLGWLAIGSSDESKFQPDMGTLFLELLAKTICHRLAQVADGP